MNQWINRGVNFRYFAHANMSPAGRLQGIYRHAGRFRHTGRTLESATLVQTGKIRSFPCGLVGTEYWSGLVEWIRLDGGRGHDFSVVRSQCC